MILLCLLIAQRATSQTWRNVDLTPDSGFAAVTEWIYMDRIAPDTTISVVKDRWRGIVFPSGVRMKMRGVYVRRDSAYPEPTPGGRGRLVETVAMRFALRYEGVDTSGNVPWREPTFTDTVLAWWVPMFKVGSVMEIGWKPDSTVIRVEAVNALKASWTARIYIRREPMWWDKPRFGTISQ